MKIERANLIVLLAFIFYSQLLFGRSAGDTNKITHPETSFAYLLNHQNYAGLISNANTGYTVSIKAQNPAAASLFSFYAGLGYEYSGNLDSAVYFFRISELLGYKITSPERYIAAQMHLADVYYNLGKPDSVSVYQKKMLVEINSVKTDSLKIHVYKRLADIYADRNEYDSAITAYLHVVHYEEQVNDTRSIAIAWVNIGNAYLQMSNSAKALPYFLRAMPYLADYEYGQVICADNTGAAYTNLKMYDSAIVYHEKAIEIARKIKDSGDICAAYEKLSAAFIGKKEYSKAKEYLKPALRYALSRKIATEIIDGENFLGEAETGQKNYKAALTYFINGLQYAQQTNHNERVVELYMWLATTADSVHDYSLAARYYSKYISLNDSLTQESSKKTIAELETKYQTTQKEQQINLLNQKSKTQVLALQEQRNTTWFLLSGLISLAVILTVYLRYRSRLQQFKKLTEVRNNISRDLHDEIGSTLSSINIYSEVATNKIAENTEVKQLLKRIHESSAHMMESMSDIVWYVNPKNDNAENVIIKMREYAAPVLEAKQTNLSFVANDNLKKVKLSMLQRQNFYLLFKEAINNVAKYASAQNVFVSIQLKEDNIYLTIEDDGKGFNMNEYRKGNGLINMQQRAKLLNGNCIIKSIEHKGTIISTSFPVYL